MKKLVHILLAVFLTAGISLPWQANAQAPEKMSYQAVMRDANNNLVINQTVGIQISILQGTASGTAVYTETQTPVTNTNGLVMVEIGTGTSTDDFSKIDWANGPYFISTEIDLTGGTTYTITGTSQLLSVPYALHAKTVENITETDPKIGLHENNYLSKWDGTVLVSSSVFDNGNVGIGTDTPSTELEVHGKLKITGGSPAPGKVLTSDATGLASWEPIPEPVVNQIHFEVKLNESYDWPMNSTIRVVDFSSNSTVWSNQGFGFNTSTNTFTAPVAGIYSFHGSIYFTSISQGTLINAFLKAGNKNYYGTQKKASGEFEMVNISMTLFLSAGQNAQLWGFVSDPDPPAVVYGNTSATYAFTYFSGAKVH